MPTLIVWGLSDRVIPVAAGISYHRRIPHSRLEIFERTGHLPQLERPHPVQRACSTSSSPTRTPVSSR